MPARRHAIAFGAFAVLVHSNSFSALNDAGKALLLQGQYWQAKGDPARASEAWEKLLLIDSQQADALYGLGLRELKTNRAGTNRYLEQLKKSHPGKSQTLLLDQAIALQVDDKLEQLEQARLLAAAGELDKAIPIYQQIFAGNVPQGELGLEFYECLGYTTGGWVESRQGLERLQQQSPDNAKVKLVLAKLLLRNEVTRTDGIARLVQLSTLPELGREANKSWREGLMWLGSPGAAQIPLFEEYLKTNPGDVEIRARMNNRGASAVAVPQNSNLVRGFKALQDNQLNVAERAFVARLKEHAQDADALGGLGIVRQRQGRMSEAKDLLKRATVRGANSRWQAALENNRYWDLLGQADKAKTEHDLARARSLLQQAIVSKPRQVEGYVALGGVQAEQNQLGNAEASYQQALTLDNGDPAALLGLITLLAQNGQANEGLRMIEELNLSQQKRLGDLRPLRAAVAVGQAKNAERSGDLNGAIAAQQEAVRNDPQNVWTRYDLARLYVQAKIPDKARQAMAELREADPQRIDALYVSALLSSQLGEWSTAQSMLARIPANQRDMAMQNLASDVQVQSLANQAASLAKMGERSQAITLLRRAELVPNIRPEFIGTLASVYAETGETEYALSMLGSAMMQSGTPSASLRLAYAGVLLKAGDDVQVNQILHELQSQPLAATDQHSYEQLHYIYTVRQADLLREKGDLVAAYNTLAPDLVQRPNDPLAVGALARLRLAKNETPKAIELYQSLIDHAPNDPQLQLGMARALIQSADYRGTEEALGKALKMAPNDVLVLATAAGLYRAQGKNTKAAQLYARAVALQAPNKEDANPRAAIVTGDSLVAKATLSQTPPHEQVQVAQATSNTLTSHGNAGAHPVRPSGAGLYDSHRSTPANQADLQAEARRAMRAALDQIRQERSARVTQGMTVRSNDSEAGLGKITDVETPLEISVPMGDDRMALQVTPVSLSADRISESAKSRFGGFNERQMAALQAQLASNTVPLQDDFLRDQISGPVGRQKDEGVGLAVAYESPWLGLKTDLGTSPMGFLYSTVVGGISVDRSFAEGSNFRYGLRLSRRPVTDSLVSFAGALDARSGLDWGGVTANGGRLQLSYDNGDYGVYGYGDMHKLVGNHVKSNSRAEAGSGIYWHLLDDDSRKLTAGLSLTGISYDNNQGNFTYGNGGYFSPQNFYSFGVPISWSQRTDRLSYSIKGSVGVQHIEQEATPYFQNDNDMQSVLTLVAQRYAMDDIIVPTKYAGQNKTGIGYHLHTAAEYRFGKNVLLGASFGLDNAQDYKQFTGGLYLRYTFEDFTGRMTMPASAYSSPYSY